MNGTEQASRDMAAGDRGEAGTAVVIPAPLEHGREPRRHVRWNAVMRDTFFAHLAGSCNVAASAAAIGLRASQIHHRRRTNPAFAAQWDEAIKAGYQLLETRMLGYVLAGGGPTIAPDDPQALGPIHWDGAIKLLTIHLARREGRGKPSGSPPRVATREETDAAIIAKLAVLAAKKVRDARGGAA